MQIAERDRIIKTKYAKGDTTYRQLGKRFSLSTERVRQIIDPVPMTYCEEHDHKYPTEDICVFHILDETYQGVELSMVELMEKLHRLQTPDRRKEVVYERKIIIKLLKERYQLSAQFIAKLLKQDITTIKHHLGER